MSLRYLRHSQLNLPAWDACVAAATTAVPYAQAWWLQATAGRWDAVVETGADGGYRSVLPLPRKRRPWGREVYQPAFTQQLGLLTTAASEHKALPDYLRLLPGRYARFYAQLHDGQPAPAVLPGYALTPRTTYHLPLAPAADVLCQGYAADYQRRLRQNLTRELPLLVKPLTDISPLIDLFRHTKGPAAGLQERHYTQLRQLSASARHHGQALLLAVYAPEAGVPTELLAAALFVRYRERLVYLFAAASPAGKQRGAPLLLLDHVIRQHAGTPGLVLDFEGGMIPSIARFFANFGAVPVPYAALTLTQKPWYLRWLT